MQAHYCYRYHHYLPEDIDPIEPEDIDPIEPEDIDPGCKVNFINPADAYPFLFTWSAS